MATKFYLHRGTANPPGTMPGASALGGTPTVSAAGASTLRWMDGTISAVAQTSAVSTTDGTANAQTAWHTRHVSAPLAAQTISAQTLTYSLAAAEANAGSNFNPTIYVSLWRPSTGAEVGAIMAVGTITATEPGTTQTATSGTGTSTSRTAVDGDVIIIETWRKSVAPGATTARTNTTFYDGTTEASTTNVATFVNFANTLTFLAQVAAPTAMSLTWTGATPTVVATDNKVALPTTLALTWTGSTPTVTATANVLTQPTALAMIWTGATPTVSTPVVTQPTALSLTWTGAIPTVSTPVLSQPTALAMNWIGATPAVVTPVVTVPSALAMTWTGVVPSVLTPVAVAPSAMALTLAFATPAVVASDHKVAVPTALDLALTFSTPAVVASDNKVAVPDALELALTFATPAIAVSDNKVIEPDALSLALAFATPAVVLPKTVQPSAFALAWTGVAPYVEVSAPGSYQPTPLALWMTWATPQVTVAAVPSTSRPRWPVVGRAEKARERLPRPVRVVPGPLRLSLAFAVPDVVLFNPNEERDLILAGIL